MIDNFLLFCEFFKTGLFAIGGGYATIPFLFHMANLYPWFNENDLVNMIAISNITPGPVGINMATYSGYMTNGIIGSLFSTFGIILAPFLITILTIIFLDKFKNTSFTKSLFNALKPASCALLTYVLIKLVVQNIFDWGEFDIKAFILCSVLFLIYPYVKKHPSLIILIGAIFGILFI